MIVSRFRYFAVVMAAIVFASLLQGCMDNPGDIKAQEQVRATDNSPDRDSPGPEISPTEQPQRKIRIAEDQDKTESDKPIVEKVGNYLTPTEYFTIRSRYFPDAIAAVSLPEGYHNNLQATYPMVIAFGGAGECSRSPRDGALAWVHYYKSDEAAKALGSNNLKASDFRNLVTKEQLDGFNKKLHKTPYRGVILVCPYSPLLRGSSGPEMPEYENYIMNELIPELCKHYRVDRARIGVDGVSMGGARSMYYGFKYPDVFRRIGSVQAAVAPFTDVYRHLIKTNGKKIAKCSIQIVSSDGDIFLKSVEKFSSDLNAMKTPHSLLILKGPHDYIFNQGPGSLALLAFHGSQHSQKAPQGPVR